MLKSGEQLDVSDGQNVGMRNDVYILSSSFLGYGILMNFLPSSERTPFPKNALILVVNFLKSHKSEFHEW